ncbi:PoNi-like cognate immunity protein [Pseudomonas putida]|uniref:PoNe immunity protein domain-containing protein n=1 Tax=Pseudomonas putida TaxID=303 RepID=UPI0023649D30|nr:PoNe immunity protein domain-containing protein [Pseudomonas putida]MDD1968837.1 PoNi-like cognate immunity protein [Pseudomonas putida]
MSFHEKRRQQFLGERYYNETISAIPEVIHMFQQSPAGSGSTEQEGWMISQRRVAANLFDQLFLEYTAGQPIESMRQLVGQIVNAYEIYGQSLWRHHNNQNEPVFEFVLTDDYAALMQLIGLCFLLHRRDLLPRIAALQDGVDGENGGADVLFEEFMIHAMGPDIRYESDYLCALKPYEPLFYALTEDTNTKQLAELHTFLKRWYKDLAGCAWHDAHKPNENGEQGGYFGYWSFEAGAAVILLGIEDDSSLHQYLYYPKDLVAWSRAHAAQYPDGGMTATATIQSTNIQAGQACLKTGWWFTPTRADSRRFFQKGATFPAIENSDYGATFWQWSPDQSGPSLV